MDFLKNQFLSEKEILQRKEERKRESELSENIIREKFQILYDTENEDFTLYFRSCYYCESYWLTNIIKDISEKFNKVGYNIFYTVFFNTDYEPQYCKLPLFENQTRPGCLSSKFHKKGTVCKEKLTYRKITFRLKKKDINKPVLNLTKYDDLPKYETTS